MLKRVFSSFLPSVQSIDMYFRNKGVADGAISYYLEHFVASRMVRYTYGIPMLIRYNPIDPEHRKRVKELKSDGSGTPLLSVFHSTISKVINQFIPFG